MSRPARGGTARIMKPGSLRRIGRGGSMQSGVARLFWAAILIGVLAIDVGVSHAQRIWAGGYGQYTPPKFPTQTTFKGSFNFCRVMFASNRREKRGWNTDYPGAEINFSIRLAELTKTRVSMDDETGEPDFVVVRLTDAA